MTELLILGGGGHSKVVAETALSSGLAESIVLLDDRYQHNGPDLTVLGWPVIGPLSLALEDDCTKSYRSAFVGLGNSRLRMLWLSKLLNAGYHLPTIIHPSAVISPSCTVRNGTAVFANAVLQSHVDIGHGCIINTSSSVDHDSRLSSGVHICPGSHLAGNVTVGPFSFIGIGATVIQNVTIGSNVTVGASAAVLSDLPSHCTAVGVPASIITFHNPDSV